MKTRTIHSLYIIGILVGIIVLLATYKVGDEDSTIKYITFASTISSLLLATIAIIYAYFSNFSIAKAVGKVTEVSSGLENHGKRIERYSEAIEKNLQTVPGLLEGVKKDVGSSLDEFKEAIKGKPSSGGKRSSKAGEEKSEMIDDKFFAVLSFAGAMLFYALKKANEKKAPLNLVDISKIAEMNFNYFHGIIVLTDAIGITDTTEIKYVYNVIYLNEIIKDKIEPCILDKQKRYEERRKKDQIEVPLVNYKNLIDKYFDE